MKRQREQGLQIKQIAVRGASVQSVIRDETCSGARFIP
jgi:hypothetical protein